MMSKARTMLGQRRDQLRLHLGELLHVAAVTGMQDAPRHPVADLVAVPAQFRPFAQHLGRDLELLGEDRRHALFTGNFQRLLPALHGQHLADLFGEGQRLRRTIRHLEHGHGRAQAQEPHAVSALGLDLAALPGQRQATDLDHVVEHAGEDRHHLTVTLPVEAWILAERIDHEAGKVD